MGYKVLGSDYDGKIKAADSSSTVFVLPIK